MGLRWPLSRGSQFKLHVLLGVTEKSRIAPKFPRHLFSKDHQSIIINYGIFNKSNMHGNAIMTWSKMTKLETENTNVRRLFSRPSYLSKITLKKPLSRGSRFKIHFCLERRGNRGSRLNFHGIPFSKTIY